MLHRLRPRHSDSPQTHCHRAGCHSPPHTCAQGPSQPKAMPPTPSRVNTEKNTDTPPNQTNPPKNLSKRWQLTRQQRRKHGEQPWQPGVLCTPQVCSNHCNYLQIKQQSFLLPESAFIRSCPIMLLGVGGVRGGVLQPLEGWLQTAGESSS